MSERRASFVDLIGDHEILVCAGSGGVGKTTASAVVGLEAALSGQRVLVLTIDPARRLANSLGLDALGNEASRIDLEQFEDLGHDPDGELWAMMLDMKASFDRLVAERAPDEETREAIFESRFYEPFSTSLSGTQEYAAAERLYEIHNEEDWDLLVLDTPPTTHALDFLEAPTRLAKAVDSKAFQWLYNRDLFDDEGGLGLWSLGTNYVLKTLGRFTGMELLEELSTFLENFSPMLEGFRERSEDVEKLLTSDACSFVVVTSPDPHTLDEATHFYEQLGEQRVAVDGFLVNGVHPKWVSRATFDREPASIADRLGGLEPAPPDGDKRVRLAEQLLENAADFHVLARKDEESLEDFCDRIDSQLAVATVPYFSQDIHSLEGLDRVRRAIFDS